MFCSNCGTQLEDDANFCPKCGKKVASVSSIIYDEPLTDPRDGKSYKTVKMGEQIWMAENFALDIGSSRIYKDDPALGKIYGRLYDWETAKKACPKDWHLPTYEEWEDLYNFAGGNKIAGKKLKSKTGWNDFEGKSGNGTDDFGFAALPGGCRKFEGDFINAGFHANWWSNIEDPENASNAGCRWIGYKEDGAWKQSSDKHSLRSVRYVKGPAPSTSSDIDLSAIFDNFGKIFEPAQQPKGTGNCPKCSGSGKIRVKMSSIFGDMTSVKTCPDCNGTGSIASPSQSTSQPSQSSASSADTFTDKRDGKAYKTVKIGERIWMAENLAFDAKSSKCYDDDPGNVKKYGRLYNSETAIKACPKGWHIPSREEWQELIDFVADSAEDGKKLKSESGWSDNDEGESGNGTDEFGFAALPGGRCSSDSEFSCEGEQGLYWYKEDDDSFAYAVFQNNSDEANFDDEIGEGDLLSIRCVRD